MATLPPNPTFHRDKIMTVLWWGACSRLACARARTRATCAASCTKTRHDHNTALCCFALRRPGGSDHLGVGFLLGRRLTASGGERRRVARARREEQRDR